MITADEHVAAQGDATRNHSQKMLNALASVVPGFLGGSADLAPSNMTLMKAFGDFQKDSKTGDKDRIGGYAERNLRFGVREHAMGAICNGAPSARRLILPASPRTVVG